MVQETYDTHPEIRAACEASISAHAASIAADIAEAMDRHRVRPRGPPKAWRCTCKPCCRARLLWRRPRAWPLRQPVSITCAATSSYFSKPKGESRGRHHEHEQPILAMFIGSKTSPRRAAWDELSETDRRTKEREGIAAWRPGSRNIKARSSRWAGPGKTKKVTERGIEDTSNGLGAFTVVRADSHEQPPSCLRSTLTLRFSRAIPLRSCPCCRYPAVSRPPRY